MTAPTIGGEPVPDAEVRRIAPDPMPTLVVSEIFGPTVQGEGPSAGRRAAFVRLGGCNLSCAWCDTPWTWDSSRYDLRDEMTRRSVADIVTDLAAMDPSLVVITGGEPLLQQGYPGFEALIGVCGRRGVRVEIETNGTVAPADWLVEADDVAYNVSPKLAHAGDPADRRIVPAALAALVATGSAIFKFVVRVDDVGHHTADLDAVDAIVAEHTLPAHAVWVMPEGRTADAVLRGTRVLADPVIARGYNLTTRLHVLVWGDERGR